MKSAAGLVSSLLLLLGVAACASSGDAASENEAELRGAAALPAAVREALLFSKPSSIDQSTVGVVLGEGVAFAFGSPSGALPSFTTLDGAPFTRLMAGSVSLRGALEGSWDALYDYDDLVTTDTTAPRLLGRAAAPILAADGIAEGDTCTLVCTEMDMYSSAAPKLMTLSGKVDQLKRSGTAYQAVVKSSRSTGGDCSVLVCGGKLAGIRAGAGSQGEWHEFRSVDADLATAFTKGRTSEHARCKSTGRCR